MRASEPSSRPGRAAGHVPYLEHRTEILDQTRNFLYVHLDLSHAGR